MANQRQPNQDGKASAQGLKESSAKEERRVEQQKGSPLAKGADRVEERSKSSDGKSPGEKQQG